MTEANPPPIDPRDAQRSQEDLHSPFVVANRFRESDSERRVLREDLHGEFGLLGEQTNVFAGIVRQLESALSAAMAGKMKVAAATLIRLFRVFDAAPAEHRVPVRFGMSAMMGLLTLMSVVFAIMRMLEAPTAVYVFIGVQTLAICLLQMRFNDAVRGASMLVGAIWLPMVLFPVAIYTADPWSRDEEIVILLLGLPCLLVGGAICGYLNGTIAAGLFLVLSRF